MLSFVFQRFVVPPVKCLKSDNIGGRLRCPAPCFSNMCIIEQKMGHGFGQVTCKLGAPNCGGATVATRRSQTVLDDVGCGKNKGQQRLNIVVPPRNRQLGMGQFQQPIRGLALTVIEPAVRFKYYHPCSIGTCPWVLEPLESGQSKHSSSSQKHGPRTAQRSHDNSLGFGTINPSTVPGVSP